MQLKTENGKTTLIVTEQGAFLDGYDDAGSREQGTGYLLDALGASLAQTGLIALEDLLKRMDRMTTAADSFTCDRKRTIPLTGSEIRKKSGAL